MDSQTAALSSFTAWHSLALNHLDKYLCSRWGTNAHFVELWCFAVAALFEWGPPEKERINNGNKNILTAESRPIYRWCHSEKYEIYIRKEIYHHRVTDFIILAQWAKGSLPSQGVDLPRANSNGNECHSLRRWVTTTEDPEQAVRAQHWKKAAQLASCSRVFHPSSDPLSLFWFIF